MESSAILISMNCAEKELGEWFFLIIIILNVS